MTLIGKHRVDANYISTGKSVVEYFGMEGNTEIFHQNGLNDPAPSCAWWYWNDGNCRLTHCFKDGDTANYVVGNLLFNYYDFVRSKCVPFRAGGTFHDPIAFLDIYNDEDESTLPPTGSVANIETHENGMVSGKLSLDEYMEWRNATDAAKAEKESAKLLRYRQVDGDDSVEIHFTATSVRNPQRYELGPRLGSGVGYTYESSKSTKFGVVTTLEIGGAWSIFTASAGIEMSFEETFTVTEGLQFNVQCENQGQITFWPFYTYYEVTFQPSGTSGTIWVPEPTGDRTVNGEIAVGCVG